jgi:hypothetical protein
MPPGEVADVEGPLMRMPSPSSACSDNTVTHVINAWGTDADGGRTVLSTTTYTGIPCSVQPVPGKWVTMVDDAAETGLRLVYQKGTYEIIYPDRPAIMEHDLILWTEDTDTPVTHTLVVIAVEPSSAGRRATWAVTAEERS